MEVKVSIIIPVYNTEKYLGDMLASVKAQTFTDFEAIIIDDGSTDGSQNIINQYCKTDVRFKCYRQKNSGVSAARNKGLDLAKGEYILFFDADDIIPYQAIEKLYRSIKSESADIAIGIMKELSAESMPVNLHTKNISKMKDINKFDVNLIYSFSLANKMFKRAVIEELGLRFERVRHTEDGIFVFKYIHSCGKITGCKGDVYYYRRRASWEEASVTQEATVELLADFIFALDTIAKTVKQSAERERTALEKQGNVTQAQLDEQQYRYLLYSSTLYDRFVSTSLINGFYRLLWRTEDKAVSKIEQKIEEYRTHMFPSMWQELLLRHRDLRLTKGLQTKTEIEQAPLITFIISSHVSDEWINQILRAIYMQMCPCFEIFLQEEMADKIDKHIKEQINLHFVPGDNIKGFKANALKQRRGDFLCFVDEDILVDSNTILNMCRALMENLKVEFVTVELRHIQQDNTTEEIPCHSTLFYKKFNKRMGQRSIFNCFDWMSGNKLFRADAIKGRKFKFSEDPVRDMQRVYSSMHFLKVQDIFMFTPLTNGEIRNKGKSIFARLLYKTENKRFFNASKIGKKQRDERKKARKASIIDFCRRLLPIRKKVLFISVRETGRLLENSQALYNAVDAKKVVIAAREPHALKLQLKIMYHLFTSKVIITDDYLKYLRLYKLKDKQKVIQIWHACGLFKKFGLDYLPWNIEEEKDTHAKYDCVTISADSLAAGYASAFGIETKQVRALGVPRTDMFFDKCYIEKQRNAFFKKHPELKDKKIVLYAPTFREKGTQRIEYKPGIDWRYLSEQFGEDVVILIKNHPVMKYNLLKGKKYKNIKNMNKASTYDLMFVSDLLITDYSSVIFEYALLDKPMLFYCPDYDQYERDFYLKFPKDVAGECITDPTDLPSAIRRSMEHPDKERMRAFRERYMNACDGHSAERIAALVKDYLGRDKHGKNNFSSR